MCRYCFLIIAVLFVHQSTAQNLVSNGSFEVNVGCPNQIGQVDKAAGWSLWGITPDYFNSCANIPNPIFGTPYNNRGYQVPHTGQAYMGLFTFADFITNGREFIGRELLQPLVIGQTYFVSMWVNHVDTIATDHSTDKIGIRFSMTGHSIFDQDTALNNGDVFATTVISDTANWVQVQGTFFADSAYTHIGIGNYFDDANTTLVVGSLSSNYAYYLVDDICVTTDPVFCTFDTGIEDLIEAMDIKVYPNPNNGKFKISGNFNSDFKAQLYELTGKMVFEKFVSVDNLNLYEFNFKKECGGMYYLKLVFPEFIVSKKMVLID